MHRKIAIGVSALAASVGFWSPARAADQAAPGPNTVVATADSNTLEEIIVTARRREERAQETPVTISALSGTDLVQRAITRTDELQYFVPSLSAQSFNRDSINQMTIRGLPGVSSYIAGAPVTFTEFTNGYGVAGNGIYTDLSAVEVLKGPQGTLFGQNALGGAVLFSPQRPTDTFGGYAKMKYGSYQHMEFEGALNLPIVPDKLSARFVVDTAKRDGFTKDVNNGVDYDNQNFYYLRASFLWTPTSKFENYLYADFYHSDTHGQSFALQEVVPGSFATFLYGQDTLDNLLAQQERIGPRHTNATYQGFGLRGRRLQRNLKIIDSATYTPTPGLSFKNIFSYQEFSENERDAFDGVPFDLVKFVTPDGTWEVDRRRYTDEVQANSSWFNNKLSLVTGAFYSRAEPRSDDLPLFCFACDTPYGAILLLSDNQTTNSSFSVYGHGILDLGDFVRGLKIAAGYRHNWDRTHLPDSGFVQGTPTGPRICGNGLPNCIQDLHGKWNADGWEVNISEQIDQNKLIYIRSGSAYTQGGFNSGVRIAAPVPETNPTPAEIAAFQSVLDGFLTYAPEQFKDVEIGAKVDWRVADRPLRTNAAVFYGWYDNIQRQIGVIRPDDIQIVNALGQAQNNFFPVTNAASATVKGVELSVDYLPTDRLSLSAGVSYTDASYSKWPFLGQNIAPFNKLPYFPAWKASGRISYILPLDQAWGEFKASADIMYNGSQLFNLTQNTAPTPQDPILQEGAYTLFNLRLDWSHVMGSAVDLALYGENVGNKTYRIGAADARSAYGLVQGVYGNPEMWFVEARYHF